MVVYCDETHYPAGHRAPKSLNLVHPALDALPMTGKRALRELLGVLKRRMGREPPAAARD
jgi:hypothetical protein